jgi:hypothetical protein
MVVVITHPYCEMTVAHATPATPSFSCEIMSQSPKMFSAHIVTIAANGVTESLSAISPLWDTENSITCRTPHIDMA